MLSYRWFEVAVVGVLFGTVSFLKKEPLLLFPELGWVFLLHPTKQSGP